MERMELALYAESQLWPAMLLFLFIVKDYLRFPLFPQTTIYSLLLLCGGASIILGYSTLFSLQNWGIPHSICFLILCVIACRLLTNISVFINIFILLLNKSYMDAVDLFTNLFQNQSFLPFKLASDFAFRIFVQLVIIFITFPLLYFFIIKPLKATIEISKLSNFWKYLWIIPGTFYFIYHINIPSESFPILPNQNYTHISISYIWSISSFLIYYLLLRTLFEITKSSDLQETLHIFELQSEMQREQYEQLKQNIESTRAARHDLRHHLLALKGYVDTGDLTGLKKYLENYLKNLPPEEGEPLCDNYAVNIITRYYMEMASSNQIATFAELNIPKELPIIESDFCVILGNLLENAVEACIRTPHSNPYIKLNIALAKNNMLLLSVENSYQNQIHSKEETFLSSKRKGQGIGVSSVKHITKKYNGISKFEYENGIFKVSILLNPIRSKSDKTK